MLEVVKELLGPGCQNDSVGVPDNIQGWRKGLFEYAKSHNFDGCEENRCPQVFIARYTNHSQKAIEKLQHSVDKYVFISVFLKSFCDSFVIDEATRSDLRAKTLQAVRSLKDGMSLVSNLSSQEGTTKPCARNEIDANWAEKAKSFVGDVISAKTRPAEERPWEDRQGLHETVAKGIVERLNELADNEKYGIYKQYSSEALTYLPYEDDERHGFLKLPGNYDLVRSQYRGINCVATRRMMATLGSNVTSRWAGIEKNASEILDATL
ncbi:hypothetical protein AAVH_24302 [Aphelenchoides avenae]|nr:hypothetical protein AAVH_24302 [Aphelenchus avenae]